MELHNFGIDGDFGGDHVQLPEVQRDAGRRPRRGTYQNEQDSVVLLPYLGAGFGRPVSAPSNYDDADVALATQRMGEWVAEGKPAVPLAVVRLVRAGDTYMRAFRKYRGMTQEELSAKTGVAQGYLSDIEGGRKSASEATLGKIADALQMHPTFLAG